MAEKPLRRCVLGCGLILDDTAPPNAHLIAQPKGTRKTRAHCPSPNCNWCQPCMRRRHFEIEAREAEQRGEIPPDQMT